ncbi:MAG: glycosyl hydrolase [Bacteroidota bacterium]
MRLLLLISIFPLSVIGQSHPINLPIDSQATAETKALYTNLGLTAAKHIIFGQQDALAYGVEWKEWHKKRTDIKDVCGNHPALFGWEMSKLGKSPLNIDSVSFREMKAWIKEAYKMGGVNTISWHMDNFLTGGDSWNVGEKVVASILPGGVNHEAYLAKLDHFASFLKSLKVGFIFRTKIPIIFRPFHEHTGNWFWWGEAHCKPEEYVALWRFTVHYLKDKKKLHHILWCYSPDIIEDQEEYLRKYPGDEYVDILGLDDYHDLGEGRDASSLARRLAMVVQLAEEKGKIAVLSETGQERIPEKDWWTNRLLGQIKGDPAATKIAYLMVWRNARKDHHYGPYPGHPHKADFIKFSKDPVMLFQHNLPNMYKITP